MTQLPAGVVPEWHDRANCNGLGDVMFPDRSNALGTADAKRICRHCQVRADCLEDALNRGDFWGVRGGLSPNERRREANRRARAAARGRAA